MGYQETKAFINANIKQNGKNEITGSILNTALNDVLDSGHDEVNQLGQEISYYTEGSQLSYEVKNWLRSNIDAILFYDSDYAKDRKYGVFYVMLNHPALGGSGYLGFQIKIKDSSNNVLSENNYRILATSLKPYSTYIVPAESGDDILFIRTKQTYSWETKTLINSGDLLSLQARALGKDVLPFIEQSLSQVKQDISDIKDFDDKLGKSFDVINPSGLTPQQIGLIADIYVVGNFDIPVGNKLVVTYIGFNNSNLGGVGKLGLQFAFYDGNAATQRMNCVFDASIFQAGKLYKNADKDSSGIGSLVDAVYIRTSDTFVWIDDDILVSSNTILEITELGYGQDVKPFYLTSINRPTQNNIITVGKGAGYDYNTLTAATNSAPNGSTIVVYPGIYENECINAGKTKTLYIIGIDRDKCVIKNNLGEYQYAVIHIASGLLRNLTVIQEGTDPGQTSGAYGVHADFSPAYQSTLRIENCHLQSNVPNTGGIGIGLNGGHLTLKGCRVVSGTSGRALYLHDAEQLQFAGEQRFTAEDCIFESPDQAIIIQGQGKADKDFSVQQFYIEFCRNIIKGTISFINWYSGDTLGSISVDDFQGVKNLRLVETSWGNSESVLNNPDL